MALARLPDHAGRARKVIPTGRFRTLKDQLAKAGTPIPDNDLWIAAVGLEHGLPVATRDQHFARVPGLEVFHWR